MSTERERCARSVCAEEAAWVHPDAFHRKYCTGCKILIERFNPELRGLFTPIEAIEAQAEP